MYSYIELRKKYPEFIYEGFDIEQDVLSVKITYHFQIKGLSDFAPAWTFPLGNKKTDFVTDRPFREMAFHLGMVELISYWKTACPPVVHIKNEQLGEDEILWWKTLYFNGLGEFYYTNGIDENEHDFMKIVPEAGIADNTLSLQCESDVCAAVAGKNAGLKSLKDGAACMVPIGGGKDSAVSLEILRKYRDNIYAYIINPRGATIETIRRAGMDFEGSHVITAKRTLDKNMLELNKQGFLNGHTPFSAIVAFSAAIAAYMNDITYIALSNESSANESTVPGSTVNHQYSKSFRFERDFHEYDALYQKSGAYYFSLLRPLSEFQIAALFSSYKKYHDIFKSCNAGSKQDIWCKHCSKCLFVWLIMSPFLSTEELCGIFGTDMAEDADMQEYFDKLVGIAAEKPFECVGSVDEVNAAVTLAIRQMKESGEKLPLLFRYYCSTGLYEKNLPMCEKYFGYYDGCNLLPEDFEEALKQELKEKSGERRQNSDSLYTQTD